MTSISARLTLFFAVLVTATVAVVLVVGGWLLTRAVLRGVDALNDAEFQEIRDWLPPHRGAWLEGRPERLQEHVAIDAPLYFFQVREEGGGIVFRSPNLGEALLPDLLERPDNVTIELPPHGHVRVSEFVQDGWRVEIASPLAQVERVLADYVTVSVGLVIAAAALSLGLGYGFSRFAFAPVRAIERTAEHIRADNLGERIPLPPGRDELRALAELLNRMFDRLQASFEQTRRFTADASHELKTPLALMRLQAEKLRPRVRGDAEAAALVDDLLEEVERMHRVIEGLLFLARAEAGAVAVECREVRVEAFMATVAEDAAALAEDAGQRAVLAENSAGSARVEPVLMRQLLLNLISNAVHAMPRGGRLTLRSVLGGGRWRVTVEDEGPGLPPEQLERVFERFIHFEQDAAPERRRGGPGHGLGLAIAKGIAELHGGTITAANRQDRSGLRVVVELPVA